MEAAIFYADNLLPIKNVVQQFDPAEAKSIAECQDLLTKDSVASELTFIKSHLGFLPGAITKLEESGLALDKSLAVIEDVQNKLHLIPGPKGEIFRSKMSAVIKKNAGLSVLAQVKKVICGEATSLPEGMSPSEAAALKFCPIVSVDVERSFSVFKNLFSDRRHSFTEENLEKILVCNCFYSRKHC